MLGRDQDALDLDRALVAVLVDLVAHRHLRLAVGPQIRQHVGLAHLREPVRDPVRELDRQRHQLGRLVGGVAEHHPLVAGADLVDRVAVAVLHLERLVDALRDVGRLLVERDDDAAGVGVEAVLGARVADLGHRLADEPRDVDVRRRRDLAGDDDEARRDQRLAGDAAVRVVASGRRRERRRRSGRRSCPGCPSVTDSELKLNERELIGGRVPEVPPASDPVAAATRRSDRAASASPTRSPSGDAVEDGADALGDRHLDPEPVREVAQHGCGRQALDDHADLGHRLRRASRPGRRARRSGGCGPTSTSR